MSTTESIRGPYAKPHHAQRVQFYATVLVCAEERGLTRAEAFRYVNRKHFYLKGTFPTLNAFDLFVSRNRQELTGLNVDSGEIPTIWEDALPPYSDTSVSDGELNVTGSRDGFVANRERERDRERFICSMVNHYTAIALTDDNFLESCVRAWVQHKFPRDIC